MPSGSTLTNVATTKRLAPAVGLLVVAAFGADVRAGTSTTAPFQGRNGQIAFVARSNAARGVFIFAMKADGTAVRRLSPKPGTEPAWAPNGKRIIYNGGGAAGFSIVDADGRNARHPIRPNCYGAEPDWAPDSKRIVFARSDLYVMDTRCMGRKRIFEGQGRARVSTPTWSPRGGLIAFAMNGPESVLSDRQLYLVRSDGKNLTQLTRSGSNTDPSWSPDGTKIAFVWQTCYFCPQRFDVPSQIVVVSADGTGRHVVDTGGDDVAWSPDGRKLAILNGGVFVMNTDGSNKHRLRPKGVYGFARHISWQALP